MEMNKSEKGLPNKHFAILFEGAWLFTPDPKDANRILATCPFIDDSGHECKFGLWKDTSIQPFPGMTLDMPEKNHYWVATKDFKTTTYKTFAELFAAAAKKYPFVYIPQQKPSHVGEQRSASFSMTDQSEHGSMRSVSVPIPTSLRAEGAMVTAEIGGLGIGDVFEPSTHVKRPFVTFLFIYEYVGTHASATIHAQEQEATIEATDKQAPHLIFNVYPAMSMDMDASAEMCHIVSTFETLRRSVSKTIRGNAHENGKSSLCNIAIYHGRGMAEFSKGDSGLSRLELGLEHPLHASRLASCASGAIAVHTT
jgi:hypothetical protein